MNQLILMTVVGTFIGWITNYIAIKLLFRPYKEINILGFKLQGVIPKRRNEMAENVAKTINSELININDITSKISSIDLNEEIENIVGDIVEQKIKGDFLAKNPMLKMFVNDSLIEKIKGYISSSIYENKDKIISGIIGKLEDELDFEEIMIEKMENFSLEELEEMTMKIAKNELKHIEYIGAVLGGIIGVVQFIVAKFI